MRRRNSNVDDADYDTSSDDEPLSNQISAAEHIVASEPETFTAIPNTSPSDTQDKIGQYRDNPVTGDRYTMQPTYRDLSTSSDEEDEDEDHDNNVVITGEN